MRWNVQTGWYFDTTAQAYLNLKFDYSTSVGLMFWNHRSGKLFVLHVEKKGFKWVHVYINWMFMHSICKISATKGHVCVDQAACSKPIFNSFGRTLFDADANLHWNYEINNLVNKLLSCTSSWWAVTLLIMFYLQLDPQTFLLSSKAYSMHLKIPQVHTWCL